jgi:hypothetical protein
LSKKEKLSEYLTTLQKEERRLAIAKSKLKYLSVCMQLKQGNSIEIQ